MARIIDGILGIPRLSRNGNFYFPQELARGDGMVIPLRYEHIKTNEGIIGTARLSWNEELMQLKYIATVTDPEAQVLLDERKFQVSLGVKANRQEKICHGDGKCFNAPMDIEFKEMSIVEEPGIPESTLNIIEKAMLKEACDQCRNDCLSKKGGVPSPQDIAICSSECNCPRNEAQHKAGCPVGKHMVGGNCVNIESNIGNTSSYTSLFAMTNNNQSMTNETTKDKVEDTTTVTLKQDQTVPVPAQVPAPAPAPVATAPAPVPAPVPVAPETPVKPTETPTSTEAPCPPGCTPPEPANAPPKPPTPSDEGCDCEKKKAEEELQAKIDARVADKVESIQKEIREKYEKKTEVSESKDEYNDEVLQEHVDLMKEVLDGRSVSIKLDKEEWIKKHSAHINNGFEEAISTTGTIPGVDLGTQIVILPGGIKIKPIRQWVEVRKIPQGDDTVRFYTLDIPAFGDITESASTDIAAATHALVSIDLTANQVRGFRQNVLKSELERFPKQLLEKIRETARIRAVEDEASNILVTIAGGAANDFGANHFDGNLVDTLITDETDEDAIAGGLLAVGVNTAKQRLEEQGHDPEDGSAVLACTPRSVRSLRNDAAVVRYTQTGSPEITRSGKLERFIGIEIFVTNTIASANNADRNIVWIKGKAFGLAIGRDIELEFDKNIRQQSVDIVATHRVNSVVIDATAFVILSTKND